MQQRGAGGDAKETLCHRAACEVSGDEVAVLMHCACTDYDIGKFEHGHFAKLIML